MANEPTNGILEEFRIEFLDCWQRLPNKGLFFVLLAAWLAMFQFLGNSTLGYIPTPSLLQWMYTAYSSASEFSDDQHGLIMPFVVLGLFWWKRKELVALPLRTWWPSLLLVVLGLMMHLAGYAAQQPRVSIVGLFVGLYGLMGLAWGPAWLRGSFFPYFLLGFCVPLGTLAEKITFPLRLMVCRLVDFISNNLLAIEIRRQGTELMDPTGTYHYEVAAACSGMRSLIATVALAAIVGFLCFPQWWKRLLLLASAFPLAVLGNLVRMLTIVIAAEMGGQEWGNAVHEGGPMGLFSLLPYIPAFAGLMALEYWLRDRKPKPAPALEATPV